MTAYAKGRLAGLYGDFTNCMDVQDVAAIWETTERAAIVIAGAEGKPVGIHSNHLRLEAYGSDTLVCKAYS